MVKYGSLVANMFLFLAMIFAIIMVGFSLSRKDECEDGREFMQNYNHDAGRRHTQAQNNWYDTNLAKQQACVGKISGDCNISKKYFIPALNRKSFKN